MLGGIHDGHVSLLRQARIECDRVIASLYLNPTQFDSRADLDGYPLTPDDDRAACRDAGVDILWEATRADLLPAGFQSWVTVDELTGRLCGAGRPGHFRGVTTVVAQLLHVAAPHRAYFGLKDFQQSRVVSRMVDDLSFDVEIRRMPIVREADGLAMGSRNRRLSPTERAAAPAISRALDAARGRAASGETSVEVLENALRDGLAREPLLEVEYADVLRGDTLEPFVDGRIVRGAGGVLIAVAARVGPVRLIDNAWVEDAPRAAGDGGDE